MSILSPYGEGYCKVCRFIVGLGPDGLIEEHTRLDPESVHSVGRKPCPGGDRTPPKRIPYAAGKNRFLTRSKRVECPYCKRTVKVRSHSSGQYYADHTTSPWTRTTCQGAVRRIVTD